MNFQKFYTRKILSTLFIFVLFLNISLLAFPKKVTAASIIVGFADSTGIEVDPTTLAFYAAATPAIPGILAGQEAQDIWDISWRTLGEAALNKMVQEFAMNLIKDITEATVTWINNGFQGPNGESGPSFISDPSKFLLHSADQTIGDMLFNDPDLKFLCAPFQLQIRFALGFGNSSSFRDRIGCTLSGAAKNIAGASIGVSASVNVWSDWIETVQPQNNAFGAYLIAQGELNSRIANKLDSVTKELNWGSGALSYKNCTEKTYNDKAGDNPIATRNYNGSESLATVSEPSANGDYKVTNCAMGTPGSTITNMLGFSATAGPRMLELRGALSDGIDSVMNALLSTLAKSIIDKVKQGVLNPANENSDATAAYRAELAGLQAKIQAQYNIGVSNINDGNTRDSFINNQMNNFSSGYGDGFTALNLGVGANSQLVTADGLPGGTNDNLAVPRAAAIARIYNLNDSELAYQNTYNTAIQILTSARTIFASSTACNYATNNATSVLRGQLINSNVVTNINGTPDSGRDVASIPWNLTAIQGLMDVSNAHIDILNTAQNGVSSAPSNVQNTVAITTAMIPVSSTSFNIDPQAQIISAIKTWLTIMQSRYTTPQCPIDISSVLSIQMPVYVPTAPPLVVPEGVGIPTAYINAKGPIINVASGPFISSLSSTTLVTGETVTIYGGQLLYGKENDVLIDGNSILDDVSGVTIQGLSLSFIMPSSIVRGPHTLSVANRLGTTSAVSIAVVSWIRCATQGGTCNFAITGIASTTRRVRYGGYQAQIDVAAVNAPKVCAPPPTLFGLPLGGAEICVGPFNRAAYSIPAGYKYNYLTRTNSVACNNSTFGDPASGVTKSCDYYTTTP